MAAVADREVLRLLGVVDLPDLPAGFEVRFARWGTGEDDETLRYDSFLPEIFASHRDALVRATRLLDAAGLDEPVDPPDHLDEEAQFEFGTVGEMILAASAYTSFLVGEASVVRVALGKAAVDEPFDRAIAAINKPTSVPGGREADEGTGARAVFDEFVTRDVVYSILVVVLWFASTQFSPRVLVALVEDWVRQTTPGVFVGTFTDCLLTLSTVHSQHL